MTKPKRKFYTTDQLAKEWEKFEITAEDIDHYLENGQLKRWKRFASKNTGKDVFLEAPPFSWIDGDEDSMLLKFRHDLYPVFDNLKRPYYIILQEVERFEKENNLVAVNQEENKVPDAELVQDNKKKSGPKKRTFSGVSEIKRAASREPL